MPVFACVACCWSKSYVALLCFCASAKGETKNHKQQIRSRESSMYIHIYIHIIYDMICFGLCSSCLHQSGICYKTRDPHFTSSGVFWQSGLKMCFRMFQGCVDDNSLRRFVISNLWEEAVHLFCSPKLVHPCTCSSYVQLINNPPTAFPVPNKAESTQDFSRTLFTSNYAQPCWCLRQHVGPLRGQTVCLEKQISGPAQRLGNP